MPTPEESSERYLTAMHGIQAAVAWNIETAGAPHHDASTPKHLRVGVDSAHISQAALIHLLVRKGLFTEEEYLAELANESERELAGHEVDACAHLGATIHFR